MYSFSPVFASQPCRLRLTLGDERLTPASDDGLVIERLINRCATNALQQATGCSNPHRLDRLLLEKLIAASPDNAEIEPRYFGRLANGSPLIRQGNVANGRPVKRLASYVALFDEDAQAFWDAVDWSLWSLLHPDPITSADLMFIKTPVPKPTDLKEVPRLTTIEDPEEQARQLLVAIQSACPGDGVTALWQSLRQAGVDSDLRRYALLYDVWLRCRRALEGSALFNGMVDALYDFTANWFGQIQVLVDPAIRIDVHHDEYLRILRHTIGQLRKVPTRATRSLWQPFRFNAYEQHPGLLVSPRGDVEAFIDGAFKTLRMTDFDMAWLKRTRQPLPARARSPRSHRTVNMTAAEYCG